METEIQNNLDKLKHEKFESNGLYLAGYPGFKANFSRDSILSALLIEDVEMLLSQIKFCMGNQGSKNDPITGEEPGKIHHEIPGVNMWGKGLFTTYNACDTTSLLLISIAKYIKLSGNQNFIENYSDSITSAITYIMNHFQNGLFVEDPTFCGNKEFALKHTYWKDTEHKNSGQKIVYPIVYLLAHAQAISALRAINTFLQDGSISEYIQVGIQTLKEVLFDNSLKRFLQSMDAEKNISIHNSDTLQLLYYLEPGDLEDAHVNSIFQSAQILESTHGYRVTEIMETNNNPWHTNAVWPFEQAFIYQGALKWGFDNIAQTAARIYSYLSQSNQELFFWWGGEFHNNSGALFQDKTVYANDPQLWTIAAKLYFERVL